jgi:DNA-binding response OmpR family regulator
MHALVMIRGVIVDAEFLAALGHERCASMQIRVVHLDDSAFLREAFDLVFLDATANLISTADVASLRSRLPLVPIVILLSQASVDDRVRYLDAGADHCMTRSFDAGELSARAHALLKRYPQGVLRLGSFRWDWRGRAGEVDAMPLPLSRLETILLEELLKALNRVAPLQVLAARIGSEGQNKGQTRLHVYIYRLRKRLAGTGLRIHNSNRHGYSLVFEE